MSELDEEELKATRRLNGADILDELDEIKANEIIRTKEGKLYKIVSCTKEDFLCNELSAKSNSLFLLSDLDIAKHRPNLINLIEEGDYVNGRKVQQPFIDPFTRKKRLLIEGVEVNWQGDMSSVYCEAEDIKSIVTKQQFNLVEYKIKE